MTLPGWKFAEIICTNKCLVYVKPHAACVLDPKTVGVKAKPAVSKEKVKTAKKGIKTSQLHKRVMNYRHNEHKKKKNRNQTVKL